MEDFSKYSQEELDIKFFKSCEENNLELVKYLLSSSELKIHADIHTNSDYGLSSACYRGHLDIVKYLLSSPDINEHADIHNKQAFIGAYQNGCLNILKYLLTSDDLKEHPTNRLNLESALVTSCEKGRLDIVKFLLTEPKIKPNIDIHCQFDMGIRYADEKNHSDILEYFVFDLNIEKTSHIIQHCNSNRNNNLSNMFKIRELSIKLSHDLYNNNKDNKLLKNKI